MVLLGEEVPDFKAQSTKGPVPRVLRGQWQSSAAGEGLGWGVVSEGVAAAPSSPLAGAQPCCAQLPPPLLQGKWTLLFSHPSDFTPVRVLLPPAASAAACHLLPAANPAGNYPPGRLACLPSPATPPLQVCTSELVAAAKLQGEFQKRGVQLVALSCNDLASHKQ